MPEQSFQVFRPGEGRRHEARGSTMFFKATSESTGGQFSLMERTLPPKGRLNPAHAHVNCVEAFYVLDGMVTFLLAGKERIVGRDTFVLVPRGTGHAFGNTSEEPARLLVMHSPALDGYFAELETLWSEATPPSVEEERALMLRYGMEPA